MAPEVLSKSKYTEKADIYSFGLVLWSMVAGQQPFQDLNPFAIANEVVNVRPRHIHSTSSHSLSSFIIHHNIVSIQHNTTHTHCLFLYCESEEVELIVIGLFRIT
jgi:serine/threonine protein kinase